MSFGSPRQAGGSLPIPGAELDAAAADAVAASPAIARVDPGTAGGRGEQTGIGIDGVPVWQPTYNVKLFGAIGDGTLHPLSERYATLAEAQAVYPVAASLTESIDRHAIHLAVTTAGAVGGGVVTVPRGIYLIDTPPRIPTGVTLRGEGFGSVLKVADGANVAALISAADNVATAQERITVEHLAIDGNKANQSNLSSAQSGTSLRFVRDTVVRRVWVYDTVRTGIYVSGQRHRVEDCLIENIGASTGIGYAGVALDYDTGMGDIGRCVLRGNTVKTTSEHGVKLYPTAHGSVVSGNTVIDAYDRGINVQQADNVTVSGNTISGGGNGICIGVNIGGNTDNVVTGNTVTGSSSHGVLALKSPGTVISANTVSDCAGDGISINTSPGCSVSGNTISGCATGNGVGFAGIFLFASPNVNVSGNTCRDNGNASEVNSSGIFAFDSGTPSLDVVLTGNRCYDNGSGMQRYGVRSRDGSDYWTVVGNNCRGNVTEAISLVGANNVNANNIAM